MTRQSFRNRNYAEGLAAGRRSNFDASELVI